jgi:hypothetical protein
VQASRWKKSGLDPGILALEFRNGRFADKLRAIEDSAA